MGRSSHSEENERAEWKISHVQSRAFNIKPEGFAVAYEEVEEPPLTSPWSQGGSVAAEAGSRGGEQVPVMEEGASLVYAGLMPLLTESGPHVPAVGS